MIQPFSSIYTKSYRVFDREPELEVAKPCLYFSDLKENFLPAEDSKDIYNAERDEAVLKDLNLKRMITTYQKSYCSSEGKKSMMIDPNNLDADQFIVHFNNYYARKTQAVPRPLYTFRRVFGYTRFDNYYTGKSSYEEEIGRIAYDYFKRDYDNGKSRLFSKKQKAMKKTKEGGDKNPEEKPQETPATTSPPEKEKICAICCEKFGDFNSPVCSEQNHSE